jgi:hypothetical protein
LRPPRRLPLSWGKGRSRAAAKRRAKRDETYLLFLRILPGLAAEMAAEVQDIEAREMDRARHAFAAYCEMAR